ncbi:MAG: helix-hairpin-helix domain-containing protein, partial [Chloroflexota bacterium]
ETAEILAGEFNSLAALGEATREELLDIPAVGPKIADSLIAFSQQESNRDIIRRLETAGVRTAQEAVKKEALPLAGAEFVFTGRLASFTREGAEARVKALGGKASGSVGKKTSYVVVGEEPGAKADRARRLNIPQLSEEEFKKLLEKSA